MGRHLTDIPPTVDQYITDIWPIVGRVRRRNIDRYSADSLSHAQPTIDRVSTVISTDRSVDTTYSKHDPAILELWLA